MWFLIIVALVVIGIVIYKNVAKAQRDQEEQERKARQEKEDREQRERERLRKEELDYFYQGLSSNPIITMAVPAVAVQYAQELSEQSKTEKYQNVSFIIRAFDSRVVVDSKKIYYATYVLPNIVYDKKQEQMAKKTTEAFEKALNSELSKYGLSSKIHSKQKIGCYGLEPEFTVTCEIGVLHSW